MELRILIFERLPEVVEYKRFFVMRVCEKSALRILGGKCSARDWDGKDYLRIIPRVVW